MQEKENKSNIKILFRVFNYVKPFLGLLFFTIFLNSIFSILTTLSISMIKPIFQILFSVKQEVGKTNIGALEELKNTFYKFVFDFTKSSSNEMTIVNLGFLIILIFLLKNIAKYFSSIYSTKLEEGILKNIRGSVFSSLTGLSVNFFSKNKSGNLISIITNDVSTMNSTTISSFNGILRELIQVIVFIFILIIISLKLTLISFSTSIASFFLLRIALKYLKKYASRMQNAMADYTTVLQETLSGIRAVKAYNAEKIVNKKFDDFTSNYVNASVKHQKIISIVPGVNEMFAIIAICVVLLIGGLQVFNGELKADDLMLFLFALFSVMSPISTIVNNLSNYQRGIIAAERVFSIIDEVPTVQTGDGVISDFNENITIKNVAFKYDKTIVLDNINFEIKKGKKIAFVGASGSGKSTMLDLIIRFYDPISGNILVDGVDISTLKLSHYRKLFGIVSQETILFNDTIANNIRYGVADITDDHILTACKIANAYGFISQLPEGLNTKIGDRGVLLSGGERQRVAIARAIVRDPKILVFDEATSALDAESEQIVQLAINDSLVNRTAIIVAHRLSTIKDCDEILIFDKGKIVERGNHQELFDLNGIYRKLYDIQFYSGDSQ